MFASLLNYCPRRITIYFALTTLKFTCVIRTSHINYLQEFLTEEKKRQFYFSISRMEHVLVSLSLSLLHPAQLTGNSIFSVTQVESQSHFTVVLPFDLHSCISRILASRKQEFVDNSQPTLSIPIILTIAQVTNLNHQNNLLISILVFTVSPSSQVFLLQLRWWSSSKSLQKILTFHL